MLRAGEDEARRRYLTGAGLRREGRHQARVLRGYDGRGLPRGPFGLVEARAARRQCGLEGFGVEGLVIRRAQAFINSLEPALRRGY